MTKLSKIYSQIVLNPKDVKFEDLDRAKMKDLKYYLNLNYEIKIRKLTVEEGGGWFAEIPLLPGCISDGETPEEAIINVSDAKKCWIETSLELGRPIHEPTADDFSGQLRVRMPKSLHRTLVEKAKEENVSLNQYINYQLARGVGYPFNIVKK